MKRVKNPCKNCKRVPNAQQCDNKRCQLWSKWFLQQWADIHGWYLQHGGQK